MENQLHPQLQTLDQLPDVPQEEVQEVAAPQVEAKAEEQQEKPKQNDRNIRQLRQDKERAERERDEMLQRIAQLEAKNGPQQPPAEEDDIYIAPDDLAEGKHINKISKNVANKIKKLEEQLNRYQQQSSMTVTETRLKAEFPDFDKVVSAENIEMLRELEPDIADSLNANPDLYKKAVSAYKLIKKFGIHQEESVIRDREKVQQNAVKPRPLTSISPQEGSSPLANANAFANGLTDDLRKQLYKEMMDIRRSS